MKSSTRRSARRELAYAGIFEFNGPLQAQFGRLQQPAIRLLARLADHHAHLIDGVLYRAEPISRPSLADPNDFNDGEKLSANAAVPSGPCHGRGQYQGT